MAFQSLSHWVCLSMSCHQPCYQALSFHLRSCVGPPRCLSVSLSPTHLSLPTHIILSVLPIDYNGLNAFKWFLMHSTALSMFSESYLLPHPLVSYAARGYYPCPRINLTLALFSLCFSGNCAGAVLWHGVCGAAVVGGLSQQICRHQRTPPLYQEADINHRCTWHFFSFALI